MRHKAYAPRRRRAIRAIVSIGLSVCSMAGVLAISQGTASAQVANIAGCGTYDFDPAVLYLYALGGGPNGSLGCPTGNVGYTPDNLGIFHAFQKGSVYWKKNVAGSQPQVVLDPARLNWAWRGWERSFLGWPVGSTTNIVGPNNEVGTYTRFEGGSIFSSSAGTFEVHGAILQRFGELGVPTVGFPKSDELDFTEGGKISEFTNGAIYWWPDTGPLFLRGNTVTVTYSGLMCFRESDDNNGVLFDDSDEVIVTLGAVSPRTNMTAQTPEVEDVDTGDGIGASIQLYRGKPEGLAVSILVMEHDSGDANKYKAEIEKAVRVAASGITTGLAAIPKAGPFIAMAAGPFLDKAVPGVARAINDLLNTGDDRIGDGTLVLSAKDMVRLGTGGTLSWRGVTYSLWTGEYTEDDSRYGTAFLVRN
jgi:hypothetical protein